VRAARLAVAVAVIASAADAQAEVGDPFDNETMTYQIGGGLLCSTLGAGAVGLAGGLIAYAATSRNDKDIAAAVTGMGVLTGGEIGLVYGVKRFGDEHHGTGSTGATVLGGLAGLAGGAAFIFFGSDAKMPAPAIAILATTSVIAGPLLGYHLSSEKPASEPVTLMFPLVSTPF
jgi:hypothetical protein